MTLFLSTLPSRGATSNEGIFNNHGEFLSTLPSRGATPFLTKKEGCKIFLSTLPSRGATKGFQLGVRLMMISIHAPLAGSDRARSRSATDSQNFYPRSPRGERQVHHRERRRREEFLSTLPSRGATQFLFAVSRQKAISIHAPLAGSDDGLYGWVVC